MGPNCNDIKNILSFLSSFLHTNMCSCGPSLLKIDIITIWQWIFSTILLRKLLSFFGPTMSPGNLSLLSGPCLMKYCFKKHSPAHSFSGMCPERSYLVDGFNILSDHSSQPCCCHVSGLPHPPWRACSLALCWFGLQAGKKLIMDTSPQLLIKYWIFTFWESAKFHCCRVNEFMRLWLKCLEKVEWELLFPALRQLFIATMVYSWFMFSQLLLELQLPKH